MLIILFFWFYVLLLAVFVVFNVVLALFCSVKDREFLLCQLKKLFIMQMKNSFPLGLLIY